MVDAPTTKCTNGAASAGPDGSQLIDHPRRDARVRQPGREGVPEVVSAAQVHRVQRVPGRRQR
jgi:hypothetical protein